MSVIVVGSEFGGLSAVRRVVVVTCLWGEVEGARQGCLGHVLKWRRLGMST